MKIISTGRKIDHTLQYRDLRFHREEVGKIPNDIFLPTDQTPPIDSLKPARPVVVPQPDMRDGMPDVRERSERFQASAPSPVVGGLIGGVVGGICGAVIGGIATLSTGNPAFVLGAGGLGVAGGALFGATQAANKEVQLVVNERPILSYEMTGTDTVVTPGHLKGKPGYYHTFHAHLESTNHGTYDVPRVQTVRKASA